MNYLFIIIVVLLLLFFIIKGVRKGIHNARQPKETLNGLIIEKYTDSHGIYKIVLQIRDQETHYEISPNLYPSIQPPMRGTVIVSEGKILDFDPL